MRASELFTPAGASTTAPSSSRLPPFDAEDARERLRRPWGRQNRRREALAPDAALHLLESISMCRLTALAYNMRRAINLAGLPAMIAAAAG